MSQDTIRKGAAELAARVTNPGAESDPRLRRLGGGRKRLTDQDVELAEALERLVEPVASRALGWHSPVMTHLLPSAFWIIDRMPVSRNENMACIGALN
jgi:hypothetical protein